MQRKSKPEVLWLKARDKITTTHSLEEMRYDHTFKEWSFAKHFVQTDN